jgi:hypothetical protein
MKTIRKKGDGEKEGYKKKRGEGNLIQLSLIDGCSLISNQDKIVPKQSKLFFVPIHRLWMALIRFGFDCLSNIYWGKKEKRKSIRLTTKDV